MIAIRWFVNHPTNPLVRLLLEARAHGVLSSRLLLIFGSGRTRKHLQPASLKGHRGRPLLAPSNSFVVARWHP
jgi:hypothetical protein